jgi:hypothetical protein
MNPHSGTDALLLQPILLKSSFFKFTFALHQSDRLHLFCLSTPFNALLAHVKKKFAHSLTRRYTFLGFDQEGQIQSKNSVKYELITISGRDQSMVAKASPITGILDEALVLVDFGDHEGKSVQEIATIDPLFYQRLVAENASGIFSIRRHPDKTFRLFVNPLSKADH